MTLRDDGTLEVREQELIYAWREFCQSWQAATFIAPSVELADEFARWLATRWGSPSDMENQIRDNAAAWWRRREFGLFSWERGLLDSWMRFSNDDRATDFAVVGPNSAHAFGTWLANREPPSRTRVEDLDLSLRAYNILRSRDMRFVDQIDLNRLDDPLGQKVRTEIADKLRRWRGDDGPAGVPARL